MILFDEIKPQIPEVLRKPKLSGFVRALLSALQTVQTNLEAFILAKRYELSFNGQVIYLEHRLNDGFDSTLRRIYIGDAEPNNVQPSIVTNRSEGQPTIIVRNRGEVSTVTVSVYNTAELQAQYDFIVFVPTSIYTSYQNELRAIVNYYRVAGKIWTFQTF
ncbi:MAG: hypothetical protein JNL70_00240 [Saprospiraceae bacterium]|nr:hypothetical protein [Saprospiraceae bacterium]